MKILVGVDFSFNALFFGEYFPDYVRQSYVTKILDVEGGSRQDSWTMIIPPQNNHSACYLAPIAVQFIYHLAMPLGAIYIYMFKKPLKREQTLNQACRVVRSAN